MASDTYIRWELGMTDRYTLLDNPVKFSSEERLLVFNFLSDPSTFIEFWSPYPNALSWKVYWAPYDKAFAVGELFVRYIQCLADLIGPVTIDDLVHKYLPKSPFKRARYLSKKPDSRMRCVA